MSSSTFISFHIGYNNSCIKQISALLLIINNILNCIRHIFLFGIQINLSSSFTFNFTVSIDIYSKVVLFNSWNGTKMIVLEIAPRTSFNLYSPTSEIVSDVVQVTLIPLQHSSLIWMKILKRKVKLRRRNLLALC